jgi:hypothetical protein
MNVTEKWDPVSACQANIGQSPESDAVRVVESTFQMVDSTLASISKSGFCLWVCRALGNVTICVISDPEAIVPGDYPVYTLEELRLLSDAPSWTQKMVLEAKRLAGATVIESRNRR